MDYVPFQSINGELDPKFNQGLDWFLKSEYFKSDIPITVLSLNQYRLVDEQFDYQPGNKLILHYANEVTGGPTANIAAIIKKFDINIKDIVLIGSIFEQNNEQTLAGLGLGLSPDQIIKIDYYELQTFFFHKVLGCDYNKSFNHNPSKKLKYLFGKMDKMVRLITMHKLWKKKMLDDSITGCLIEVKDIPDLAKAISNEYQHWYNETVSTEEIIQMLTLYRGSPDKVSYRYFDVTLKNNNKSFNKVNHCPSYPYNPEILFTNTKVSLIPETFYYCNQPSFITEKTYKAIYNHHPFTILGTPNILGALKNRGYKTFDSICDEIYDHCRNDRKRLNLVINATNELLLTEKLEEIDTITTHNFSQLEKNALATVEQLNNIILKNFS